MTEEDGFGHDHIRRLDQNANRTINDLIEIPAGHADLEGLNQALSGAAERLSAVRHEVVQAEELEFVSEGNDE
jgi:hypothetical protein